MPRRTKALLTLILCAPILTEIVSGNTPVHALLDPRNDLFLLMAYSVPLLVIRELAFRWRLSTAGLFVLGLAYGIWNEGLLAQTLIRVEHVPIDTFDRYIYAAGFNFSWAAVILPWHAFLAVMFPLALVAGLFPSSVQLAWLGKRTLATLAAMLLALMVCISIVRQPHFQMLACLFAIMGLASISHLLRTGGGESKSKEDLRTVSPVVFGVLAYPIFILGAIALARNRVPAVAYFTVVTAILAGLAAFSRHYNLLRPPAAVRLAIGGYLAASGFNIVSGIAHHSLERILTGGTLAATFLVLASLGSLPRVSR